MVRVVKSHQEEEENEEFTSNGTSNKEGRSGNRKANRNRSKHSETEQRRRSKINERFQILRELIPENDQKKDKATFLLEVIQYIQFLQEKVQMYEGTYHGWSSEPSKLIPWRSNGAAESFVDQSQLTRNCPGNIVVSPAILTTTKNSIDSDFSCEATYRATDNGAATQAMALSMPMATNMFEGGTAEPRGSFSDTEQLVSRSQPQFWHARPCTSECTYTSYTPDEPEELKTQNIGISDACSQGLLNTLTHALESSGVDLSQMSISVQLDVAKRCDSGMTSMAFCTKDNKNLSPSNQVPLHYEVGSGGEDSGQAQKRLRREQS